MSDSILIAGIGNIFQGDDAFGVTVVHRLAALDLAAATGVPVRLMDIGIRSIDLGFALLDGYALTILVDATARGETPGTLYTIEIDPGTVDEEEEEIVLNPHGLNPVHILSLAKSMGARFGKVLLVGCEPLIVDCDESGFVGLSEVVEAAVTPAIEIVRSLVEEFARNTVSENGREIYSHECL